MKSERYIFNIEHEYIGLQDHPYPVCPPNDVMPPELVTLLSVYMPVLEQDSFRLLRVKFGDITYIISNYSATPTYFKGVPYCYKIIEGSYNSR